MPPPAKVFMPLNRSFFGKHASDENPEFFERQAGRWLSAGLEKTAQGPKHQAPHHPGEPEE